MPRFVHAGITCTAVPAYFRAPPTSAHAAICAFLLKRIIWCTRVVRYSGAVNVYCIVANRTDSGGTVPPIFLLYRRPAPMRFCTDLLARVRSRFSAPTARTRGRSRAPGEICGSVEPRLYFPRGAATAKSRKPRLFPPKEIVWSTSHHEFVFHTPRFSWSVKWLVGDKCLLRNYHVILPIVYKSMRSILRCEY